MDGSIILKLVWKLNSRVSIGFVYFGIEKVAGFCQHGNEPSDFVKCGEFLE